jgi:hypothetical protein
VVKKIIYTSTITEGDAAEIRTRQLQKDRIEALLLGTGFTHTSRHGLFPDTLSTDVFIRSHAEFALSMVL